MYDVTCQSSFENLQTWLSECETYCTDQADSIVKLLVANKIDLVSRFETIAKPCNKYKRWTELCKTTCETC